MQGICSLVLAGRAHHDRHGLKYMNKRYSNKSKIIYKYEPLLREEKRLRPLKGLFEVKRNRDDEDTTVLGNEQKRLGKVKERLNVNVEWRAVTIAVVGGLTGRNVEGET